MHAFAASVLIFIFCCDLRTTSFRLHRCGHRRSPVSGIQIGGSVQSDTPYVSALTRLRSLQTSLGFIAAASAEDVVSATGLTRTTAYKIREATVHDLPSIVSLRINVFYPELKTMTSFYSRILEKMRTRRGGGSVCLIATRTPTLDDNESLAPRGQAAMGALSHSLLAAVEFSPGDFQGTPMEGIGADRKLYVADLAVRSDARRIGVATQLLQAIELYAMRNNYHEIYLHVEVDNIAARAMYLKNDYFEVPLYDWALVFTESRLHKSVDSYVFLWKSLRGDRKIAMDDSDRRMAQRVSSATAAQPQMKESGHALESGLLHTAMAMNSQSR